MLDLFDKVQDAVAAIQSQWNKSAHAGIILGTGLGSLVDDIEVEASLDYADIPHFAQSTAESHAKRVALIFNLHDDHISCHYG